MNNPNPMLRAWRIEKRRKELGCSNPSCLYCPQCDIWCLELDHPVTFSLDPNFTRVVCRNCHRTLEIQRDVAKLTTNGMRKTKRSARDQLRSYLLLLAHDQDSLADLLTSSPDSAQRIAIELHSTAMSLRRKADSLQSRKWHGFRLPWARPKTPRKQYSGRGQRGKTRRLDEASSRTRSDLRARSHANKK
jgi:hypothetical protein